MRYIIKYIFLFFFLSYFASSTFASHAGGMDISYECVSQQSTFDLYKVKIKFYRDCSGSPAPGDIDLIYTSSCNSDMVVVSQTSGPLYITPTCTQSGTPCSGGSLVELEEYEYEKIISLDKCSDWVLTACVNNRNIAITTIVDPSNQPLCVQAEINNLIFCNNSPDFTEYPTPYICANQSFCYNNGAVDSDGDSLVYSLETPLNSANSVVTYNAGLSFLNPISGTTNFDPSSGNLCMNANNLQVSVIAMKISEFRNGVFIGSIIRDIQIIVLSCTTLPPVLSGFNGFPVDVTNAGPLEDSLNFCVNEIDSINFSISASIGSSSNKFISWSGLSNAVSIPSFNISNNNTSNPTATFNWFPTSADAINSPFTFNVTVEDDACPINNVFSYTYTITLNSSNLFNLNYVITDQTCAGQANGEIDLTINGNNPNPNIVWNGPNNFYSNSIDINNLVSGDYILLVTDLSGCQVFDTVNVGSASPFSVTSNVDSVSCSGFNDGTIDIIISNNDSLSYLWYAFSNYINPNSTVFLSSQQDIDSLFPGTYFLTASDSTGCFYRDTFYLLEPNPFNATYNIIPPSCNGYLDGYIDLSISANSSLLSFNWQGPNNFQNSNEDISSLAPGQYFLQVSDPNNCTFYDTINIIDPPILISNDSIIICNSYVWNNITYSNSGDYIWNGFNTIGCDTTALLNLQIINSTSSVNSIVACNSYFWNGNLYDSSGTYIWNGLNTLGCDSSATLFLTINSFSSSYIDTTVCDYLVSNGNIYTESGLYNDTMLNSFGCDSIITIELKVTKFKITAVSPICSGDSSLLTIFIDFPISNNYNLFFTNNQSIFSLNIDSLGNVISFNESLMVTLNQDSEIILEYAVDINGCTTNINDSINVSVFSLPNVDLLINDVCVNTNSFKLSEGSPAGGKYYINNIENISFNPQSLEIGSHNILYIFQDSTTQCYNSKEKNIEILPAPESNFYFTPTTTKIDSLINFTNTSNNYSSCIWLMGDGSFIKDSTSFIYSYQNLGQYEVTLITENNFNCIDSIISFITIYPSFSVYIPNSFSPDFDLINDTFFPKGNGINSYKIIIYSRWGEVIREIINKPWDGSDFPIGVYTYEMEIIDFKNDLFKYSGLVRLIR